MSKHSDTRIKLADFGLAKRDDTGSGLKTYCGTEHYLAPEILRTEHNADSMSYSSQADLWSLGVVLFVLLSCTFPFPAGCRFLDGLPPIDTDSGLWTERNISATAKDFVASFLQINPQDRLTAAEALNHSWLLSAPLADTSLPIQDMTILESESVLPLTAHSSDAIAVIVRPVEVDSSLQTPSSPSPTKRRLILEQMPPPASARVKQPLSAVAGTNGLKQEDDEESPLTALSKKRGSTSVVQSDDAVSCRRSRSDN